VGRSYPNRGRTAFEAFVSPVLERLYGVAFPLTCAPKKTRKKSFKRSFSASGAAGALGPGRRGAKLSVPRRSQLRTRPPGARCSRAPPESVSASAGRRGPARPGGGRPRPAVERALTELPAKRAEVCKLRLVAGLSYTQIAQRLGICEKTVETQLARGPKVLARTAARRPLTDLRARRTARLGEDVIAPPNRPAGIEALLQSS